MNSDFVPFSDPIQTLFLESIRASASHRGLDHASPQLKEELQAELERLAPNPPPQSPWFQEW